MSQAPLHDPFGRARLPATFDRAGRVAPLAEAADALLAGRLPSTEARLFLAGALAGWLAEGGRLGALERDFLHVAAPARSTHTPARLWARLQCSDVRGTDDAPAGTLASIEPKEPPA